MKIEIGCDYMEDIVFIASIVNVVYFIIWFLTNKMRNSHLKIVRELDNGYEFYETLSDTDKERYWKENTKNLNVFFIMLLFFIELTLYLSYKENSILWILSLIAGLVISLIIAIILSVKLRKKYK